MTNTAFFQPDIPTQPNDHKILGNVLQGTDALAISEVADQYRGLTVVVTPDTRSAVRLSRILVELSEQDVRVFPDWETLPYDTFSPHQEIISSRLSALSHLQNTKKGILLLPIATLMQRLCPPQYLQHNVLLIKKGDRLVIDKMRLQLESAGYRAVEQVLEHGEYAVRGSLLDLFPMGSAVPFRLDFLMMKLILSALLMCIRNVHAMKFNLSIFCQPMNFRQMKKALNFSEHNSVKLLVKFVAIRNIFISKLAKAP